MLRRDTRARHGPLAIEPIEVAVPTVAVGTALEIAVGGAVLRCEAGTDVGYVASLVRALRD